MKIIFFTLLVFFATPVSSLKASTDPDFTTRNPTAPLVYRWQVDTLDLTTIEGGWIELSADHFYLPAPIEQSIEHQSKLMLVMDQFDRWYRLHLDLAGSAPYGGAKIRFVPTGGWVMGNPARFPRGGLYLCSRRVC